MLDLDYLRLNIFLRRVVIATSTTVLLLRGWYCTALFTYWRYEYDDAHCVAAVEPAGWSKLLTYTLRVGTYPVRKYSLASDKNFVFGNGIGFAALLHV